MHVPIPLRIPGNPKPQTQMKESFKTIEAANKETIHLAIHNFMLLKKQIHRNPKNHTIKSLCNHNQILSTLFKNLFSNPAFHAEIAGLHIGIAEELPRAVVHANLLEAVDLSSMGRVAELFSKTPYPKSKTSENPRKTKSTTP